MQEVRPSFISALHRLMAGLLMLGGLACAADLPKAQVAQLKITVLSTMVAEYGDEGEWGFSALVEEDGHRFLVDTGAAPDTVLKNAKALGIDLSGIEDVVLTHNHGDHTSGLLTLRQQLSTVNPRAMSRVHVASAIFWSRPDEGHEGNQVLIDRAAYEKTGGRFIVHEDAAELFPGVWFTGPVPRRYPERNWSGHGQLLNPAGQRVEDNIPEDSSVVFNTARGLVLLSGCGHAGVVNTMTDAQQIVRAAPVFALVGGFHLFNASDGHLDWTIQQMRRFGVRQLLGAHCTGFEAVYRIRKQLGLPRNTAIVAAVGSSFSLDEGIKPGGLGLVR